MVFGADIIQNLTQAIDRYCGWRRIANGEGRYFNRFLLCNLPHERVFKVSDNWIAAAAYLGPHAK